MLNFSAYAIIFPCWELCCIYRTGLTPFYCTNSLTVDLKMAISNCHVINSEFSRDLITSVQYLYILAKLNSIATFNLVSLRFAN